MIDDELKQRIKDANEITDVIGQFVSLHKRGINYIGICPFHPDRHPSMTVSPSRQTYRCFVCGKGGDVIQFVQDHENMSFNEAVTWLAGRAGISLPERVMSDEETARVKEREAQRIAMKGAAFFFEKHLPEAQLYLHDRGFSLDDKVLKDFRIGYAPAGNLAKKEMLAAGFSEQKLLETDILKRSEKNFTFDTFKDRIMFPYFDIKGNINGYTGRWLTPQENTGKYVNTGDTPLFKKGTHLFGLYQARTAIARYDCAYIVEGQFDAMSMHKFGVCNTVATSGTALTPEQIQLLGRFTHRVILVYDADAAGLKASLANCEAFLRAGFQVSAVPLPEGKDPDNIAQEQKLETGKWLANREQNFLQYFAISLRGKNPGTDPNREEEAMQRLSTLISVIPSETLLLKCIEIMAGIFGCNTEVIQRKVNSILRQRKTASIKEKDKMAPGIYGIDMIAEARSGNEPCILTSNYQEFLTLYGDAPIAYVHGIPGMNDIQQLRQASQMFTSDSDGLTIAKDGTESGYLAGLSAIFRAGLSNITITVERDVQDDNDEEGSDDEENMDGEANDIIETFSFVKFYVFLHKCFFKTYNGERTSYIERCAEIISYAEDSVRIINFTYFQNCLGLTKQALNEIVRPYLAKRKSRMLINAQRTDDDYIEDNYDPNELPRYVQDNPEYLQMFQEFNYYPKLNKQGEPVCYLFKNEKSGYTLVGDFYMIPLLHIYSDNDEENKRVLRINRRKFKTPLYIEVNSKVLAKKSTLVEKLVMLEAVNFYNGEEKHWEKIRTYMSNNYITCREIITYGNQQEDGFSRREDQQFLPLPTASSMLLTEYRDLMR